MERGSSSLFFFFFQSIRLRCCHTKEHKIKKEQVELLQTAKPFRTCKSVC
jgi:hypothetical protein